MTTHATISVSHPGHAHGAARRRVALTTLGCKVNAFESEIIASAFGDADWCVVDKRDVADLYVINTCTVTAEADRQARQEVRRAVRRNPQALIVVTGCYAQTNPQACATIPGVDFVIGNDRKLDIHSLLPQLQRGELPQVSVGDVDAHVSLPDAIVDGLTGHSRAFVQVQQGCDQGCTFCVIHVARGRSRSLPPTLIRRQAERLVLNGYRELVICGVDLGAYGEDLGPDYRLPDLLREIIAIEGDYRVRLSSIDPAHLDDRLLDLLATEAKLCPHVHISLQSGNTLILKRMKRRYTAEQAYERIRALRRRLPDVVLSADLMVGFPTEDAAAFEDTVVMVQELEIAFPHVFPFSARAGTPAARIPRQVPHDERRRRAARLREVGAAVRDRLLARRCGGGGRVLVEDGGRPPAGYRRARAVDYVPVFVPANAAAAGQWLQVEYLRVVDGALIAQVAG